MRELCRVETLSEKTSEQANEESDERTGGETVELIERGGEEDAASGAQDKGESQMDDPQEGTSAATARPCSVERSGRSKDRGKMGRVWGPRGDTGQSSERKRSRAEEFSKEMEVE